MSPTFSASFSSTSITGLIRVLALNPRTPLRRKHFEGAISFHPYSAHIVLRSLDLKFSRFLPYIERRLRPTATSAGPDRGGFARSRAVAWAIMTDY